MVFGSEYDFTGPISVSVRLSKYLIMKSFKSSTSGTRVLLDERNTGMFGNVSGKPLQNTFLWVSLPPLCLFEIS